MAKLHLNINNSNIDLCFDMQTGVMVSRDVYIIKEND